MYGFAEKHTDVSADTERKWRSGCEAECSGDRNYREKEVADEVQTGNTQARDSPELESLFSTAWTKLVGVSESRPEHSPRQRET